MITTVPTYSQKESPLKAGSTLYAQPSTPKSGGVGRPLAWQQAATEPLRCLLRYMDGCDKPLVGYQRDNDKASTRSGALADAYLESSAVWER